MNDSMNTHTNESHSSVTALRPDPDNPNVIGVDIDEERVAGVSLAVVDQLELSVGMPATDELRQAIAQAVAHAEVRTIALDLLGARPFSCRELADRLKRRSFDDAMIEAIIEEFVEDGWLDDAAYARILIAEQQRKGIAGPAKLEVVLKKRGVDPVVAEQVIAETLEATDAESDALNAGREKMASFKDLDANAALRRTAGWLARRGIDEHILESVMERLADEFQQRESIDVPADDVIDHIEPDSWE